MIFTKKYILLVFCVFILLLDLPNNLYAEDINLQEYPKLIEQTNTFEDLNYFIDLNYFSICDENNIHIDKDNLQTNIDNNQLYLMLDSNTYLDYNLNIITEDYNNSLFQDLYFDLNTSYIQINNQKDLNLDYNIDRFYIYQNRNNYFFINDSNLDIYNYLDTDTNKDYNYLDTIDSNDLIYNIEVVDYNNITYLFLANNSNGISIYNINDNNILDVNNHYIGSVIFNYNTIDYDTTYISSFTAQNDVNYLLAMVNQTPFNQSRAVFYKIEDLLENPTTPDSIHYFLGGNYLPEKIWLNEDQNKFNIPLRNQERIAHVEYKIVDDNLEFGGAGTVNNCAKNLQNLQNRIFTISQDSNKVTSYDLQDFPDISFTQKAQIDLSKTIYSIEVNQDLNKIYVLLEDQLTILDYNFTNDSFSIDTNLLFNNDLNTNTNLNPQHMILQENNVLNLGQIDLFTKLIIFKDYNITYYTPYPDLTTFSLSENNINHDLYHNDDFNGQINISFNLYDYNINKIDEDYNKFTYKADLSDETNTYNIVEDTNIDLQTCTRTDNRTYNCINNFNIKDLHNSNTLDYKTYQIDLNILDLNKVISKNFTFDLTHNTGGSPGGSSPSSSSPSSTPTITTDYNQEKEDLQNILDLLKQEYLSKKNKFTSFLLDLEDLNFSLDLNKDYSKVKEDYNNILSKYNNLLDLNIINTYLVNNKIKDLNNTKYTIKDYLSKRISIIELKDLNGLVNKYIFIEIFNNSNTIDNYLYIDKINKDLIYKSSKDLNSLKIDQEEYISFNKDLNYLVKYNNIDLSTLNTKPLVIDSKDFNLLKDLYILDSNIDQDLKDKENIIKKYNINNLYLVLVIVALLLILSCVFYILKRKK